MQSLYIWGSARNFTIYNFFQKIHPAKKWIWVHTQKKRAHARVVSHAVYTQILPPKALKALKARPPKARKARIDRGPKYPGFCQVPWETPKTLKVLKARIFFFREGTQVSSCISHLLSTL